VGKIKLYFDREWNLDTFYKPKEDCLSVPPLVVWRKKHTVGKTILHFDRGRGALVIAVSSIYTGARISVIRSMGKVKPRWRELTPNIYECCKRF
jgi:hypothetical protein